MAGKYFTSIKKKPLFLELIFDLNNRKPLSHPITTQFKIADFSQRKPAPVVSQPKMHVEFKPTRRASLAASRPVTGRKETKYSPVTFEEVAKRNRSGSPRNGHESARGRRKH